MHWYVYKHVCTLISWGIQGGYDTLQGLLSLRASDWTDLKRETAERIKTTNSERLQPLLTRHTEAQEKGQVLKKACTLLQTCVHNVYLQGPAIDATVSACDAALQRVAQQCRELESSRQRYKMCRGNRSMQTSSTCCAWRSLLRSKGLPTNSIGAFSLEQ